MVKEFVIMQYSSNFVCALLMRYASVLQKRSNEKIFSGGRVRLTFLHTGWEHKMVHVSRDDVRSVVRFRESWQGDQVAEEVPEETVVAVAQQEPA
jgi:hypothetical protein